MENYLPTLLVIFFIISNLVIFLKLYQTVLKYLSPSKGYAFSILTIVCLLAFDYSVYSYTVQKEVSPRDQHYLKVHIENALNRLADDQLDSEDKSKIIKKLSSLFDQSQNIVQVRKKDSTSRIILIPDRLDIEQYASHLKLASVKGAIKVNHISLSKEGKVKLMEVLM